MFAPGIVGLAMGLLIIAGVKDSPESVGYPPVETASVGAAAKAAAVAAANAKNAEPKPSLISLLVNDCLK